MTTPRKHYMLEFKVKVVWKFFPIQLLSQKYPRNTPSIPLWYRAGKLNFSKEPKTPLQILARKAMNSVKKKKLSKIAYKQIGQVTIV